MHSLKFFTLNLVAALTLLIAGSLSAQTYQWDLSVEGGLGTRMMRIDPPYPSLETKIALGYSAGIAGQYNFNNNWSLKLGAAFERKGTGLERTDLNTDGELNADYIAIPLMVKARTGKKIKFFANVGPYLGIFLSSKTIINAYSGNPEVQIDNDSSTKKTDFGISAGLGVEIPAGQSGAVTIEVRDNFGLTNISESKETDAPEIKFNTANLMIGYVFKFGKRK